MVLNRFFFFQFIPSCFPCAHKRQPQKQPCYCNRPDQLRALSAGVARRVLMPVVQAQRFWKQVLPENTACTVLPVQLLPYLSCTTLTRFCLLASMQSLVTVSKMCSHCSIASPWKQRERHRVVWHGPGVSHAAALRPEKLRPNAGAVTAPQSQRSRTSSVCWTSTLGAVEELE